MNTFTLFTVTACGAIPSTLEAMIAATVVPWFSGEPACRPMSSGLPPSRAVRSPSAPASSGIGLTPESITHTPTRAGGGGSVARNSARIVARPFAGAASAAPDPQPTPNASTPAPAATAAQSDLLFLTTCCNADDPSWRWVPQIRRETSAVDPVDLASLPLVIAKLGARATPSAYRESVVAAIAALRPPRLLRTMAPLTAGHLVTDLAQGALPALLPFLVERFALLYLQAGAVILVATTSSSIVQPLFGQWSDQRGAEWLLAAGPLASGIGVALLGFAPSYGAVLLCVLISGLGVAAYHPEGTKYAAWVSGQDRRSTGMAIFSVGGNVGVAIGPVLAGALAAGLGLDGTAFLILPGLATAAALLAVTPRLKLAARRSLARARTVDAVDDWPSTLLRSAPSRCAGTSTSRCSRSCRCSKPPAATASSTAPCRLTVLLAAGAVGTLLAGPLADRIGPRDAVVLSFLVAAPGTALFLAVDGPLGIVGAVIAGTGLISSFGLTIVLGQMYLPNRIGMASGLSIGFSMGLGGIAALGVGALADQIGLEQALWTAPPMALAGAALTLLLPRSR